MTLPPFNHYPELRSERILLREITEADAPFLLEIMTYDGRHAQTLENAIEMIRKVDNDYRNGNTVNWGIVDAETELPIGTIGYYRGFENGQGEVGFVLLPRFEGKGYMSEALQLVVQFGREAMQLESIIAVTKLTNERAIRLLERNGFTDRGKYDDRYIWFSV